MMNKHNSRKIKVILYYNKINKNKNQIKNNKLINYINLKNNNNYQNNKICNIKINQT